MPLMHTFRITIQNRSFIHISREQSIANAIAEYSGTSDSNATINMQIEYVGTVKASIK